jgi:hypothetical protein
MSHLDRDNAFAVAWGVLYSFSVVLVAGLFDAVGVDPTITVPVVVVVLPIVAGWFLSAIERRWAGASGG